MKKIPVILDVDTGIDDAVSIMLAKKSKKLDLKMIVTCHGNSSLENVNDNTLDVLEILHEYSVPVYAGASEPLEKSNGKVVVAHGKDGLGGFEVENLHTKMQTKSALIATKELVESSTTPVVYICVAPCTNLANFISSYPSVAQKLDKIIIMVASNVAPTDGELPYKEFNASVDAKALDIVLESPIKKVVVSMEMGHTAYLSWQDVYKTKYTNSVGKTFEQIFRKYADYHVKNGIATHDSCAVAYAIKPKIFTTAPAKLYTKYYPEYLCKVAVADYAQTPNVLITTAINKKKFKKLYFKALKKCKIK